MFPYPEDAPTVCREESVHLSVTKSIASQFLSPKVGVRGWHVSAFAAAMPEAAVNEDRHARFCEGKIWTTSEGKVAPPTPDAVSSEKRSEKQFRVSIIPRSNPRHYLGSFTATEYIGHRSMLCRLELVLHAYEIRK